MAVLPVDSVIQQTLTKMQHRIDEKAVAGEVTNAQSGLLFLGNVHDAVPRRLFLDSRLSPLDKMAWVMIRMYAQQNEGAVFPTYDELQLQLALPHSDKASRETISRALLMLRLTGWLSLCKRVRDKSGRVRGNIYAQHDEPLNAADAEYFDPRWLDTVEKACSHTNKTVRLTAIGVLKSIRNDDSMRHRHSRVALTEARLAAPQTPAALAQSKLRNRTGTETEPGQKSPDSDPELSVQTDPKIPSSDPELSRKQRAEHSVRKPNGYVRSFTQSVKKTYVNTDTDIKLSWPVTVQARLSSADREMLETQLCALPDSLGQRILDDLAVRMKTTEVRNVTAYLLANLKRAREGLFNTGSAAPVRPAVAVTTVKISEQCREMPVRRARQDVISGTMAELRKAYFQG